MGSSRRTGQFQFQRVALAVMLAAISALPEVETATQPNRKVIMRSALLSILLLCLTPQPTQLRRSPQTQTSLLAHRLQRLLQVVKISGTTVPVLDSLVMRPVILAVSASSGCKPPREDIRVRRKRERQ